MPPYHNLLSLPCEVYPEVMISTSIFPIHFKIKQFIAQSSYFGIHKFPFLKFLSG